MQCLAACAQLLFSIHFLAGPVLGPVVNGGRWWLV